MRTVINLYIRLFTNLPKLFSYYKHSRSGSFKKENIIDCIEQISNITLDLISEKTEINNNNFMMTKMFRFT